MNEQEARAATVTRQEAEREIRAHGLLFADFAQEHGTHEEYKGATVLDWLGY